MLQNQNSRGDILKVKIKLPQGRTKAVNTDLSFPMQEHVQFFVSFDEDDNDSTGDDDDDGLYDDVPASSHETEHKDPLYEPENQYSSTSDEEDFHKENCFAAMETTPASEPKFLVFWSCLASLFQFCFACFHQVTITRVIKRATLLVVHTKCPNKHIHKWQSQPTINGSGARNMLLSAAILFSGNTYVQISEMFNMLKVEMFSEPMYYKIQKAVLFPKLNTVYIRVF